MNYIKLFEEFEKSLNEGAIQVYGLGNPRKAEGSMTWTGVTDWLPKYQNPRAEGVIKRGIILGVYFDDGAEYSQCDKYIADPSYRSIPMGTWEDESLPLFTQENPDYDEIEFDFVEIVPREGKPLKEYWVKISDKDGVEFMVEPHMIIDIIKGGSVKEKINPGEAFLIKNQRGIIYDFGIINPSMAKLEKINPGEEVVIVVLQNREKLYFTLEEWRRKKFYSLDEKEEIEE